MKILLLCVLFSAFAGCRSFHVPVLAWTSNSSCYNNNDSSGLTQVKSSEFGNILMNMIEAKCSILLFVEELLAVEDFSSRIGLDNETFYHLQDIGTRKELLYFPRVYKPLDSFKGVSDKYSVREHNISDYTNYEQYVQENLSDTRNVTINVEIIYIGNVSDNKSRSALLKEHDKMITDICSSVEKVKDIVCVITGLRGLQIESLAQEAFFTSVKFEAKGRKGGNCKFKMIEEPIRRHCKEDCVYSASETDAAILIHLAKPPVLTYGGQKYEITDYKSSVQRVDDSLINFKITSDDATIYFNFTSSPSEIWELTDVAVDVDDNVIPLKGTMRMKADSGRSIICKRAAFYGEQTGLHISKMQVQPFFWLRENTSGNGSGFGGPEFCIPFFSIAVFMAYITTCGMILVLSWGFGMIQVIGANKTFDGAPQKILLRD